MKTNRQLFYEHVAQTSDFPLALEIEKAEGVYMYGQSGEKIMDIISGIGVSNVGHRHPKVVEAIREQADRYLHLMVYGEFVTSPQVKLAEAITHTLPNALNGIYFLNSGSEAIEGALKLAKRYTQRNKVVAFNEAYHGSSHGALSATGNESLKSKFRPLVPGFEHYPYNGQEAVEAIDDQTACVLIETVQGEAGVRIPDKSFMLALQKKCKETGTLLVTDEIQCGFGRTGKFWAFEHFGLEPDIVVCAKGMGGGMPIGAFIARQDVMGVLKNKPILGHISTFGGHPVSCAASLATLNVIQDGLLDDVEKKATYLKKQLNHPAIKEIRSIGLMMAVEFESFELLKPIIDKAIGYGVLTDWFLFCDNSMRIAPPLIISMEEIDWACQRIKQAIHDVVG